MSRIYHLLDESEPFSEFSGGAISRWAANVLRAGDEIVVCPDSDASWKFPEGRTMRLPRWSECGRFHPLLYRSPWALQVPVYRSVLRPLFDRLERGDVLYVHNRPECVHVLADMAEQAGVELVLHMHNSLLHPRSRKHLGMLHRITVVFCSEFLRNEVNAAYPEVLGRTHIVYNGADYGKFSAPLREPKAKPEIVFTGRLVPNKGVHVLMDAMRLLEQRGVSARCTIVGGSSFGGSRPTQYVRKLHRDCPANTELVGYKSGNELADVLRRADIYCCPSVWNDPFPLSPLEAMASGLPVVASRAGGIPEALAYGGGLLVEPNDVPGLADALQRLVGSFDLREQLGREASAIARERFVWTCVRDQYETVVGELQPA